MGHLRATYNDIHLLVKETSSRIASEFWPDLLIAIGAYSRFNGFLQKFTLDVGGGSVNNLCSNYAVTFNILTEGSFRRVFW